MQSVVAYMPRGGVYASCPRTGLWYSNKCAPAPHRTPTRVRRRSALDASARSRSALPPRRRYELACPQCTHSTKEDALAPEIHHAARTSYPAIPRLPPHWHAPVHTARHLPSPEISHRPPAPSAPGHEAHTYTPDVHLRLRRVTLAKRRMGVHGSPAFPDHYHQQAPTPTAKRLSCTSRQSHLISSRPHPAQPLLPSLILSPRSPLATTGLARQHTISPRHLSAPLLSALKPKELENEETERTFTLPLLHSPDRPYSRPEYS
ncbi:hypothetical protein B0H14DRAFT_3631878 [Mycena olivaceomarginata]|nr:hypothetical protein B0H14DRAFT_3631878 [Mycena olivaceomarginata]